MSKINDDIIEQIRAAADIVTLIGEDIALRRQGVNYVGLCPFHGDRTPSLVVSPSKKIYKCFACGEGGSIITWYQKVHGMSFPEAVRAVGKRCGIEVPEVERTPEEELHEKQREAVRAVLTETEAIFAANLTLNDQAKQYLQQRGVTQDSTNRYNIGASHDHNRLSQVLLKRGYSRENIVASGVAYMDEHGELRDTWWGRVMFPFHDYRGRVVSFTGRDIVGTQPAKYKNGPETVVFKKDRQIFGLWQARQPIAKKGYAYVCEGQMDVISLSQCGLQNVVAASGTAFSEYQRKLLHGQTGRVVLLLDGDSAGTKAAMKHIPTLVADGFEVLCVALPGDMDPDDFVRAHGKDTEKVLKNNTVSYVEFLSTVLFIDTDDTYTRRNKVQQIVSIIASERDEVTRGKFLSALAKTSGYSLDELGTILRGVKQPEQPETFHPGFYGMELAVDYIDPNLSEIHLTRSFTRFQKELGNEHPFLYAHGVPSKDSLTELSRYAKRIVMHRPNMTADPRTEGEDVRLMKDMYTSGLTVDVSVGDELTGFLFAYIRMYGGIIRDTAPTPEQKNTYLSRVAEMVAYASAPIQTVNIPTWADVLGLKVGTFRDVLKPFIQERKASKKLQIDRSDFADILDFDTEKVPDYVEQTEEYAKMFRRYGFYPALNKDCEPVCYIFRGENGNLRRACNFYMEPLFHVYSDNSEENKRVVKLTSLMYRTAKYVEIQSKAFVKLTSLREKLVDKGAYDMSGLSAADYEKVWSSMISRFPMVYEVKVFGQQPEGCFLFANGIVHEVDGVWTFEHADEMGLIRHGDFLFYSPAFSNVNTGIRQDADRYEQDRWLVYSEPPKNQRITFERWAQLMDEVYKINDNGKWAMLYAILCAFRSDIFPINRQFTAPFFIGPTMSGKTQIAVSIRSLFIKPGAPSFNLNSGTDAAFFSILERFRDVPQIMEEYNDEMISDNKFQGLKSVTYDDDGKQKRKSATSNDVESSKVNAPVILLGQEAPQKDDNALTNRVVLCEVPKREDFNEEHARTIFEELKNAEKAGLSHLLLDVLKLRPIVQEHFAHIQKECVRELQREVEVSGTRSGDQIRLILTVSMFLAMLRILMTYAPHLPLPFTYEQFRSLAVDKIRQQVELLTKTDKLAAFFAAMDYLIDAGKLRIGRDIKIEMPGRSIRLKGGVDFHLPTSDTRILYMNLSNVHNMYVSYVRSGDKPISLTTLEVNLNSHPAYIGRVANTRFRWFEAEDLPMGGVIRDSNNQLVPNDTLRKTMQQREKSTSAVVMNYDILRSMAGIDLERSVRPDEEPAVKQNPQQNLPF